MVIERRWFCYCSGKERALLVVEALEDEVGTWPA